MKGAREVHAPRGTDLSCRGWSQEAAMRMLMNNLDPDVAERPDDLVVYGGTGRAARSWEAFDAIVATLRTLRDDETLLVQSGTRLELAISTRGAHSCVRKTPTGLPDWTSSVSSSSNSRSDSVIASNASQDRAARPLPP